MWSLLRQERDELFVCHTLCAYLLRRLCEARELCDGEGGATASLRSKVRGVANEVAHEVVLQLLFLKGEVLLTLLCLGKDTSVDIIRILEGRVGGGV